MSEPLLSIDVVSKLMKLDEPIVTALAEAGHLPAVRVGQRWRVPPPAIDEFYARVCRGEVPADITPVNGIILPHRSGASVGQQRGGIRAIQGKRGQLRGAS